MEPPKLLSYRSDLRFRLACGQRGRLPGGVEALKTIIARYIRRRGRDLARVTSRFSPVSREAFQAPKGPSLPCHALCAVYLCGRWGHQESLDKLRKVNCGRSAPPPCSAPLANLRARCVSRVRASMPIVITGDLAREDIDTLRNRIAWKHGIVLSFFFFPPSFFPSLFAITFKISPFFEANLHVWLRNANV